ncbi:hypothetical protein CVT24_007798 [Panaeolus cyanescens]|uniref:Auxin efflux carrier n=1 Tax=Panaeolus cyanescens TaxID=181874 RepID=A0A409YKT7_9AGAR|nr:hypothetical protein CVT24_007798 [Panaeolus cyanescens]
MLSTGALIWVSARPLIRLIFCVTCGFVITKADIFPAVASRGAGQILLNITLPCLMFSKIVPAFTAQNISALGPLIFVALLYEAMGIALAWIIRQFFWVPHRFRYGLLVAGGWGNVGDIPNAVVMSVTGAAPFTPNTDQNLSVAYISAFILVFMVTLFPFGGHRWIAMDYLGPDVEPEEVQEAVRRRRRMVLGPIDRMFRASSRKPQGIKVPEVQTSPEKGAEIEKDETPIHSSAATEIMAHSRIDSIDRTIAVSPADTIVLKSRTNTLADEDVLPTHSAVENKPCADIGQQASERTPTALHARKLPRISRNSIREFFKTLFTPASISIFISFPIALIPQVKALFIQVPNVHMPSAPDGQPPLAFILDTATFMGNASVPLGLVCLGSALARLHVPRKGEWQTLPLGAIAWLAVAKILLMPILGILIVQGLTKSGMIDPEDKVLRFVCIFCSCLPTASTQVFLTQVYSGTGSAEHLSAFLIPQYALMIFGMTVVTAYTINLLF